MATSSQIVRLLPCRLLYLIRLHRLVESLHETASGAEHASRSVERLFGSDCRRGRHVCPAAHIAVVLALESAFKVDLGCCLTAAIIPGVGRVSCARKYWHEAGLINKSHHLLRRALMSRLHL